MSETPKYSDLSILCLVLVQMAAPRRPSYEDRSLILCTSRTICSRKSLEVISAGKGISLMRVPRRVPSVTRIRIRKVPGLLCWKDQTLVFSVTEFICIHPERILTRLDSSPETIKQILQRMGFLYGRRKSPAEVALCRVTALLRNGDEPRNWIGRFG
jgi:hypothetical protein